MRKGIKAVKSGKRNTAQNVLIRFAFLAGIFFAFSILLLFRYFQNQRQLIIEQTEKSITVTAEKYATSIRSKIQSLEKTTAMLSVLFANDTYIKEEDKLVEALSAFCQETDAYLAVVVNRFGEGINHEGDAVRLDQKEMAIIKTVDKLLMEYPDKDRENKKSDVIISKSISGRNKYVISYYKLDSMANYIDINEYDSLAWAGIIDENGKFLYVDGGKLESLQVGNSLLELVQNEEISTKLKKQKNMTKKVLLGEKEYYLTFVPIKINDCFFVMGITNAYVERMVQGDLSLTYEFIRNFGILMTVFFLFVIGYNIVNRTIFSSKSASLQRKADTDLLTELNNKIATEKKIKEYMEENQGEQALLFVFDIDNFKKINDTRGHVFGDEVLRCIGMRLKSEFRMSDVVGRTGGDEFMLFLKNIKDDTILKKESLRVSKLFENFQVGQYTKYSVTASIGCAVYPRDAENFEELYKAADKGLYKAKQRGKNQLAFYNEEDIHKPACENVGNMTNE